MNYKIILIICLFLFIPVVDAKMYKMEIGDNDVWFYHNPSWYIMPNNDVVQGFADKLYIDELGKIRYINDSKVINFTYVSDMEQFGMDEYWLPPYRFILNGFKGDCEDGAIMITSIMRSGNISIYENGSLVKIKVNALFIGGKHKTNTHGWVEYKVYNNTYLYSFSSSGVDAYPPHPYFKPYLKTNEIITIPYFNLPINSLR